MHEGREERKGRDKNRNTEIEINACKVSFGKDSYYFEEKEDVSSRVISLRKGCGGWNALNRCYEVCIVIEQRSHKRDNGDWIEIS